MLLGGEESSCDGWVQQHQRRLHDAYAKAATQLNNHADQRKPRHDRHARELPLAAGERMYLRKHIECPIVVGRERPGRPRGNIFALVVSDSSSTSGDEEGDVLCWGMDLNICHCGSLAI